MHLYNPRIVVPGSLMPPFPWLFEQKLSAGPGDRVLALPDSIAPKGSAVVATREALALTDYLLGLDRSYPAVQARADTTRGK